MKILVPGSTLNKTKFVSSESFFRESLTVRRFYIEAKLFLPIWDIKV